jgi:cytochrome c-type biogenesis protein CcmH/NrfG
MSKKNKKKETTSKKLSRIVTLILGLGFGGSMLALSLSGVFSQSNSPSTAQNNPDDPSVEEQMQLQASGYEKVLQREPSNLTALEGLMQIYLQTGDRDKAVLTLEKLVKHHPEQSQYVEILKEFKQREAAQPVKPKSEAPETK